MITLCPVCRKRENHPVSGWTAINDGQYWRLVIDHQFRVDHKLCPNCLDAEKQTAMRMVRPSFVEVEFTKYVW